MEKQTTKHVDKKEHKLSDQETLKVVLKEMKEAVPEIEKRVKEQEARVIEKRNSLQ